ncbi:MAG: IPT/TIG domain-containing protein, partial [Thermoanaerobaculia bacterium]
TNTEQWAIYRMPASARDGLNNEIRMSWILEAGESTRTLDWAFNGFRATEPGCNLLGCNCIPVTVRHPTNMGGGTFVFPLADNTPAEEPELPQLTSLSSTFARAGAPITLQGSDLRRVTRVFFGTSEAQVFFVDSDSQITVLVPANTPGAGVMVTVVGSGGISNGLLFRYK